MDHDLESLRRAAERAPDDREAREAYLSGLLRAGQRDALERRLRFELLCPLKWEELEQASTRERYCGRCDKAVYWVDSPEEALKRAARGDCIAMRGTRVEQGIRDLASGSFERGAIIKPSCLVSGAAEPEDALTWVGSVAVTPPVPSAEPPNTPKPDPPGFFERLLGRRKDET